AEEPVAEEPAVATETEPKHKPKLFAVMPEEMHGPDGLTVSEKTGTLFLTVPNFNGRDGDVGPKKNPGMLAKVGMDGSVEKLLVFPVLEETGQTGCMGIDFGPDGHLYVADNQYFFKTDHRSRILRVVMDGDVPTGKVEVVAEGLKLPNAVLWVGDTLYVTDTFLDLPDKFGAGGIWAFSKEEILKAGTEGNESIKVLPNGADPRLVVKEDVAKIGRGDNGGFDGLAATPDGTLYAGNFGNGALYAIRFAEDGKPNVEMIHGPGDVFDCCDGIFYDKGTDRIYINDSAKNAIRAFKPTKPGEKAVLELIWENGETDGADGLLDQPCECVVIGDKMYVVNFDWPFPGMVNVKYEAPSTMSVIELK
ncbi:MAG TPA: hypothetical protein DEB39_02420, partial [Planctomycetaceae bacterium]|nr:hypothetical protein [Planctomycetaceae bacterium]